MTTVRDLSIRGLVFQDQELALLDGPLAVLHDR